MMTYLEISFVALLALCTLIVAVSFHIEFCGKRKKSFRSKKKTAMVYLNNVMFYIYVLYAMTVMLAIVRYVCMETFCTWQDCHAYFTITYKWAGALIISLSTLVPLRLLQMKKNPMKSVSRDNVKPVLMIIAFYVVALVAVIVAVFGLNVEAALVTTCARVFFMTTAFVELTIVFQCLAVFKGSSAASKYLHFVKATVFMRGGIVITIAGKYLDLVPTEWLKFWHMAVICIGLAYSSQKQLLEKRQASRRVSSKRNSVSSSEGSRSSTEGGAGAATDSSIITTKESVQHQGAVIVTVPSSV